MGKIEFSWQIRYRISTDNEIQSSASSICQAIVESIIRTAVLQYSCVLNDICTAAGMSSSLVRAFCCLYWTLFLVKIMVLWDTTPSTLQKDTNLEETTSSVYSVNIYTKINIALCCCCPFCYFSFFRLIPLSFSLLSSFSSWCAPFMDVLSSDSTAIMF